MALCSAHQVFACLGMQFEHGMLFSALHALACSGGMNNTARKKANVTEWKDNLHLSVKSNLEW